MAEPKNPESSNEQVPSTEANKTKNKSKSSWILNCLFLCGLGFLLWGIIAPQFKSCSCRAYSSYTKSDLHNVYLACKAYWADNGSENVCTHEFAQLTAYGYVKSSDVKLVSRGIESDFLGFAYNEKQPEVYKLDTIGTVERFSGSPMDALISLSRTERSLVNNGETL